MYREFEFCSLKIVEKCFPNVFEPFLRSTATSKILPFRTEIYFPCGSLIANAILSKHSF